MSEVCPQASDIVGALISSSIDRDEVIQTDLVQCAHCAFTWPWRPGQRLYGTCLGRCMICGGLVCGTQLCSRLPCTSQLRLVENIEQGRPDDYVPVFISTSGLLIPR